MRYNYEGPATTLDLWNISTSNIKGLGEEDERRSAHHLDILGLKLSKIYRKHILQRIKDRFKLVRR